MDCFAPLLSQADRSPYSQACVALSISALEQIVIIRIFSIPVSGRGRTKWLHCMYGEPKKQSTFFPVLIQLFSPVGYYSCLTIREARPAPLQDFSVHPVLLANLTSGISCLSLLVGGLVLSWDQMQDGLNLSSWGKRGLRDLSELGQGTNLPLLTHSHVLMPLSHFLSYLCKPEIWVSNTVNRI